MKIPLSFEADMSRRPEKPVEDVAGDGLSGDHHHPCYRLRDRMIVDSCAKGEGNGSYSFGLTYEVRQ